MEYGGPKSQETGTIINSLICSLLTALGFRCLSLYKVNFPSYPPPKEDLLLSRKVAIINLSL
jgi:hypothetical protein